MKQMIKETAPEVKREIPAGSKEGDYSNFPRWLYDLSNEQCYEILSSVARIERYPNLFLTHVTEVARFLGIPKERWRHFKAAYVVHNFPSANYPDDFPILHKRDLMDALKQRAKENGTKLIESFSANGSLCVGVDGNPSMTIEVGNRNAPSIKYISMRGVIAIAHKLAYTNGYAYPQEIAKRVIEATMKFFIKYEKELEVNSNEPTPAEPAPTPETPAEPTPEPAKMDYAETLRKLFDSVLTLVEKQAEERGAEKIVQKLKDAGKL